MRGDGRQGEGRQGEGRQGDNGTRGGFHLIIVKIEFLSMEKLTQKYFICFAIFFAINLLLM